MVHLACELQDANSTTSHPEANPSINEYSCELRREYGGIKSGSKEKKKDRANLAKEKRKKSVLIMTN